MTRRSDIRTEEAGIALVEVLVAAVLLIVLSLATLAMVDVADSQAGKTQARSVASGLLSSEQQRLRTLSAVRSLTDYSDTQPAVTVSGRRYVVSSRVDPARDSEGIISCSSDTSGQDYLRSQSTVTWDGPGSPMTSSSLITASEAAVGTSYGTLTVRVQDGESAPVAGLSVTAAGRTKPVNGLGCAVFENVAIGPVTVTLSARSGYVGPNRETSLTKPATVVPRSTANVFFRYAQARDLPVRFTTTTPPTASPRVTATPVGRDVSLTNGDTDFVNPLAFAVAPAAATTTVPSLFPFAGAYTAYAGGCAANDPTKLIPVQPGASANLSRTVATVATVDVLMPAVALRGTYEGAAYPGANLSLIPNDAGCDASDTYSATADSGGRVAIPAPYGTYRVCGSFRYQGTLYHSTTTDPVTVSNLRSSGSTAYANVRFLNPQPGGC